MKEATEITGFSSRIIHLHEERGLIKTLRKKKNGNRYFDSDNIHRLIKIQQLQLIGLSLDEISEVLDLYFDADDYGISGKRAALNILNGHLLSIEKKEQSLRVLKSEVIGSISKLELLLKQSEEKLEDDKK